MHFMMRQHLAEIQCHMLADEAGVVVRNLRVWVIEAERGYCFPQGLITIPTWVFDKSDAYRTWYLAHELTHWIVGTEHQHDPTFESALAIICPSWCLPFEEAYKIRRRKQNEP